MGMGAGVVASASAGCGVQRGRRVVGAAACAGTGVDASVFSDADVVVMARAVVDTAIRLVTCGTAGTRAACFAADAAVVARVLAVSQHDGELCAAALTGTKYLFGGWEAVVRVAWQFWLTMHVVNEGFDVAGCNGFTVHGGDMLVSTQPGGAGVRTQVVPSEVYGALVKVEHHLREGVCRVSAMRRLDGAWCLQRAYDAASSYTLDMLPDGRWLVPGGGGVVCTREFMMELVQRVLCLPVWADSGYCYLRVLPAASWSTAMQQLGRDPTVAMVREFLTRVGTGPSGMGLPPAEIRQSPGGCHVVTTGALPPLTETWVLGSRNTHMEDAFAAEFRPDSAPASHPQHRETMLSGDSIVELPPVGLSTEADQPVLPFNVGAPFSSSPLALLFRSTAAVPYTLTEALRRQRADGAQPDATWDIADDTYTAVWLERMSAGPPLGWRGLDALTTARPVQLPAFPGVVLQIMDLGATEDPGMAVEWRIQKSRLPGWFVESARISTLKRGRTVMLMPPASGALCRYEFESTGDAVLNNTIVVRSAAESSRRGALFTVWSAEPVSVFCRRDYRVWRAWSDHGAQGVGAVMVGLQAVYHLPAVRHTSVTVLDKLEPVVLTPLDGESALVGCRVYGAKLNLQVGTTALACIPPEGYGGTCAMVAMTGVGLRVLWVGNTQIKALQNGVGVIVEDVSRPMKVATVQPTLLVLRVCVVVENRAFVDSLITH